MTDMSRLNTAYCPAGVSADGLTVSFADLSDSREYTVLPGFCDVHVHFREPGYSYKETIATGCAAAAHGGYTAVCPMPNLDPVPDSAAHMEHELAAVRRDATVAVYPYAALTVGERGEESADLEGLAPLCVAFSDDGKGVQSADMMRGLMRRAKSLGKVIAAHCEVNDLLHGGYIHDGGYAAEHGHRGICSASEYEMIARDLELAAATGCAYHVCHISTKESVTLIREAKRSGVDVTCETGPHYLVMDDSMLWEDGRFKMNPPLRGIADREALVEGMMDGTIDMIATDHAPHSAEEKARGLEKSSFGVVGLETAFPVMFTHFVRTGRMSMERLLDLMVWNPRRRFGLPVDPASVGYAVWDLNTPFSVDPDTFLSKGRATPFAGWTLYGINKAAYYKGNPVFAAGRSVRAALND